MPPHRRTGRQPHSHLHTGSTASAPKKSMALKWSAGRGTPNSWMFFFLVYPLVNKQFAIENGPVEIVDLPWCTQLENGGSLQFVFFNVYQAG